MNQGFTDLYKKAKTGKRHIWQIRVINNSIFSKTGELGGKLKESIDIIRTGKNEGKINQTTPHEQAVNEAKSRWQKKLDQGWVTDIHRADAGETEVAMGGWWPMLAEKYHESSRHIEFPCFTQPKLDGLRATWHNGRFYSRTRKPFPSIKHIEDELKRLGLENVHFDGELYCHELKDNFETIVSMVKRGLTEHPDVQKLQFHIFDIHCLNTPFGIRSLLLYGSFVPWDKPVHLKLVSTSVAEDHGELMKNHAVNLLNGYEGTMIRNQHGLYEERRSKDLQKLKMKEDAEFAIIGIEEGKGNLMGHVGAFVCAMPDGVNTFSVKLKGKLSFLKECFEDHSLWQGKKMTVEFMKYTGANGVPRDPRGLRIRGDE